jgi:hypothetical protein
LLDASALALYSVALAVSCLTIVGSTFHIVSIQGSTTCSKLHGYGINIKQLKAALPTYF